MANLGNAIVRAGDLEKGRKLIEDTLHNCIENFGGRSPMCAGDYRTLAMIDSTRGRYDLALTSLRAFDEIQRAVGSRTRQGTPWAAVELAQTELRRGNLELAETHALRGLALSEADQTIEALHRDEARATAMRVYIALGRLHQARVVWRTIDDPLRFSATLGHLQLAEGETASAASSFEHALAYVGRRNDALERARRAGDRRAWAEALRIQGDVPSALEQARIALEDHAKLAHTEASTYVPFWTEIAHAQLALARPGLAIDNFERALAAYYDDQVDPRRRAEIASGLAEGYARLGHDDPHARRRARNLQAIASRVVRGATR